MLADLQHGPHIAADSVVLKAVLLVQPVKRNNMNAKQKTQQIKLGTLASGFDLTIPILIAEGITPNPIVGISAAVHGDEIVGVQILRELWSLLAREQIQGSVWLMPVVNPLAFEYLTRNTPLDMLDINRTFPGNASGWISEQMAHAISEQYLSRLDYYIDIHAGGTFPLVDYCYSLNDDDFARAFHSKLLYKPAQLYQGTTAAVTLKRNVPTVVIEIGGGYEQQEEQVKRGVSKICNMLRYAGVLRGAVEAPPSQTLLREMSVMRPKNGGLCYPVRPFPPGEHLEGRVKLAEIVSPYSFESLETLETPFEKNVVVLSRNYVTRVNPGDYTFMIGNLATAETL